MKRARLLGAVLVAAIAVGAGCSHSATRPQAPSSPPSTGSSSPGSVLSGSPSAPSPTEGAVQRPPIVWKPIPFPSRRKAEMAAYAERHYGIETYRLRHPQVIVEHITVSRTFAPVFSVFSRDVPDRELHELPGLCTHFVIDTDGTVYQLVPLGVMCRHAVGLNYTAIGIEHVGQSDQEVLNNPEQLAASTGLTLWLMQRFDIQLRNVIGHNESLTSPFHRELVPRLRCQTHGDWTRADMDVYRGGVTALARGLGILLGPPPHARPSAC